MLGALLLGLLIAAPSTATHPADPWAGVLGMSRDEVVKAAGAPSIEFIAVVDDAARPLQISPVARAPVDDEGKPRPHHAVSVLQYAGGVRGMDFQVVLRDGKVAWAVVPPAPDEADTAAVAAKYGKPAVNGNEQVARGDVESTWEVLAYPGRGRSFVAKQGAVVARVILPVVAGAPAAAASPAAPKKK